jgi:hypothetical protein
LLVLESQESLAKGVKAAIGDEALKQKDSITTEET